MAKQHGLNVTQNKGKGMDRKQDFTRSTHYPGPTAKSNQSTSTHSDDMRIVQQSSGR